MDASRPTLSGHNPGVYILDDEASFTQAQRGLMELMRGFKAGEIQVIYGRRMGRSYKSMLAHQAWFDWYRARTKEHESARAALTVLKPRQAQKTGVAGLRYGPINITIKELYGPA